MVELIPTASLTFVVYVFVFGWFILGSRFHQRFFLLLRQINLQGRLHVLAFHRLELPVLFSDRLVLGRWLHSAFDCWQLRLQVVFVKYLCSFGLGIAYGQRLVQLLLGLVRVTALLVQLLDAH